MAISINNQPQAVYIPQHQDNIDRNAKLAFIATGVLSLVGGSLSAYIAYASPDSRYSAGNTAVDLLLIGSAAMCYGTAMHCSARN